MPFDSGSLSFRIFELPEDLKDSSLERFAKGAPPPIKTLDKDPIQGWVSSYHLLDRVLTEENSFISGYLVLTLMKAEKKVPDALLRAYCRMEEVVERRARGVDFLNRKAKREVKERVMEQLMPGMPPTLTGIPMLFDFNRQELFAAALSDKQIDAFVLSFRDATDMAPMPVTPQHAAMRRRRINFRDLGPTVFSPDPSVEYSVDSLGLDFFTWLWFFWESTGGNFAVPGFDRPFAVMIDDPLTFVMEGGGAHEAVLKKGTPLISVEAKAALMAGKKLRKGKVIMAKGDDMWTFTFDAEVFSFRGVKLPKGDAVDAATQFQERVIYLQTMVDAVWSLYDMFLDLRGDKGRWDKTVEKIHNWISNRTAQ